MGFRKHGVGEIIDAEEPSKDWTDEDEKQLSEETEED